MTRAKVFAPSLLLFTILLTAHIFATATDVSSSVSRRLGAEEVVNYGDIINLKNQKWQLRWLSGARDNGNIAVYARDYNSAAHGDPNYEQDRIATYQWTIQMNPSSTGSGCVEYGGTIYLKNNYLESRWLNGARSNGNEKVVTKDFNSANNNYYEKNTVGEAYEWTVQATPTTTGSGCLKPNDTIYLKNRFMDNRWLTGARGNGNEKVYTRDYNDPSNNYYEQNSAGQTYQWIVELDNPPTAAPTLAPTTQFPTYPAGTCFNVRFQTDYNPSSHSKKGDGGQFYIEGYGNLPGNCHYGRWGGCDIEFCGLPNDELKITAIKSRTWNFAITGDIGPLIDYETWDGTGTHFAPFPTWLGAGKDKSQTYRLLKAPTTAPTSVPTLAPTTAPTLAPTTALTPGGACYNLEETYYASEANWCYKVETGKGSNDFFQRKGSNDCKARFTEASASEWYVGNAALGQYHYTKGSDCAGKPREGTVTIIEEARTDTVGTATSGKNKDGVCFYKITIRRPPCHTSVPTIAPTVAATPGITASQGNTRTISAQGDPIILGLKGQVFKFDGRDGGWYANIASKSFNWNMQFKEYPTCKEGSDVFISGMSLLTSKESDRQHQTSESDILIATTPYQIEECRGHDKNCLGDGTLHISFDGGKSYVSNPGDYHYASRNRVVAHNTYGACSRRWYDYNITPKQSKFSRLGGRRVTVEEKKPFELLTEKAETMINPGECLEWVEERKSKNDLFEQKGLWSTVHVQTPSVAFHIEYRQSNPEKSDKECDFQSLDAWMVTVSKDLEEQTWEGILGETKENIYDAAGHQIMSDRNVLLRGKEDADYEVDGPFGTTFNAQKKVKTSILSW